LASARASYLAAAELARTEKQEDRRQAATQRAEALSTRVSTLTIEVPVALSNAPDLRVTNNGVELPRAAWGAAMPSDGGTFTIEASAQGRTPWSSQVLVGVEHDQRVVTVPVLLQLSAPAPLVPELPPQSAPPVPSPALSPASAPPERSRYWTVPHAVGWAALGAGTASGVTALYFALAAKSAERDVERALRSEENQSGPASSRVTWDSFGHAREVDGEHAQALAQGFGIASGVLLLGGAALVLFGANETEHAAPPVSLAAGPGAVGVDCAGTF
jgi:hypothetical protein